MTARKGHDKGEPAGGRRNVLTHADLAHLTPIQAATAKLNDIGWTPRRIARELHITETAVRQHLTNAAHRIAQQEDA